MAVNGQVVRFFRAANEGDGGMYSVRNSLVGCTQTRVTLTI
jgi:hypothetical protein